MAIILVVAYFVILKFKPNILSDTRAIIPTKVSSDKIPSITSSAKQETEEKIALLKEQISTNTVT